MKIRNRRKMYQTSDRGLRKAALRNGCRLEKTSSGWAVLDAVTDSLVAFDLSATQVLDLFV